MAEKDQKSSRETPSEEKKEPLKICAVCGDVRNPPEKPFGAQGKKD